MIPKQDWKRYTMGDSKVTEKLRITLPKTLLQDLQFIADQYAGGKRNIIIASILMNESWRYLEKIQHQLNNLYIMKRIDTKGYKQLVGRNPNAKLKKLRNLDKRGSINYFRNMLKNLKENKWQPLDE